MSESSAKEKPPPGMATASAGIEPKGSMPRAERIPAASDAEGEAVAAPRRDRERIRMLKIMVGNRWLVCWFRLRI